MMCRANMVLLILMVNRLLKGFTKKMPKSKSQKFRVEKVIMRKGDKL